MSNDPLAGTIDSIASRNKRDERRMIRRIEMHDELLAVCKAALLTIDDPEHFENWCSRMRELVKRAESL